MMGFNLNRKKNDNLIWIRYSSWLAYFDVLEGCLEAEEEERIINAYLLLGTSNKYKNLQYKYKDFS